MAVRGSTKRLSVEHEEMVARRYGGRRSPSSGGSDADQGDVRTKSDLIECKLTGGPGRPPTNHVLVSHMEKVAAEAYSEGKQPVVALRYWAPESPLADPWGWVDLAVRLLDEDVYRASPEIP